MSLKTRVTITDVAQHAGVSPKSISRVINGQPGVSEETRRRILESVSKLGYVANPVARRLRGSANVIGLIVSDFEDYIDQVMRGISLASQRLGYNVVLYVQHTTKQSVDSYLPLIGSGLVGGVLLVVPHDLDILVSLCNQYKLPYVMIDYPGSQPTDDVPTITVTNRKGFLDATRYLLALGHKRIGFITGLMEMASAQERLQGYKDALAEVGLPLDPSLIMPGDWTQREGFEQCRKLLLLKPRPTAILASDDISAFGAMDAIKDAGLRVGEDISVIGFDDLPMAAQVHPTLTTVRQPLTQLGEAAVDLLMALLRNQVPNRLHHEYSTELVIRQSTGRPRE
jgi:LacI family transcriptional regulator